MQPHLWGGEEEQGEEVTIDALTQDITILSSEGGCPGEDEQTEACSLQPCEDCRGYGGTTKTPAGMPCVSPSITLERFTTNAL